DFQDRLPSITGSSVDGGVAPARPSVTWTSTAPLGAADGTYVHLRWQDDVDGGLVRGSWTFVVPPSALSVVAPSLPAGTLGTPTAAAAYQLPAGVVATDVSFVNGYGELRRAGATFAPTDHLLEDQFPRTAPPLPKNGSVRYSAFTVSGD
ncbi:MAG TPA: hypothetical protein VM204_02175, partial [Gaiellaceae bacterium]|nr:hypothetical protein [Gaiellaceae bacterium]